MGYTVFYQEVRNETDKITWKEILSECRKKHSKADLEYALLAGSTIDTATEANMLQKWHKPWVFYPLLKGGIALLAILYAAYFITPILTGNITSALYVMVCILPPLITPVILMIFLWELNIPRNISLYELLGFFLVGGLLSFCVVSFLFNLFPSADGSHIQTISQLKAYQREFAFGAAAREEPAKLAAGLAILCWCSYKKKKIYGLTGLVAGAAVGAGFGGFESVSYAMSSTSDHLVTYQLMRAVLAIGGHVLYAAPYMAAVALEMKSGKIEAKCFASRNFMLAFGASFLLHFAWDYVCFWDEYLQYLAFAVIIILLWVLLLYITRQCLQQAVCAGRYHSNRAEMPAPVPQPEITSPAAARTLVIRCVQGSIAGSVWRMPPHATSILAGRDVSCQILFPHETKGISRRHCEFRCRGTTWTVTDLNSTYGTWLGNGKKLVPGIEQNLRSGDVVYLADKQNMLKVEII